MKTFYLLLAFTGIILRLHGQLPETQPATAGCDADFLATPDTANPLLIRFEDRSSGPITQWQWSFGDGATSTQQHPVHTYPAGGTYFVCLTVSSNDSLNPCHDVLCIALTIHEPGTCVADYTSQPDAGNRLRIFFTDLSSGNINHWHWDFGDGTVSEERNPVHQFPGYLDYRVCLTAYHSDSIAVCNDVRCDTVTVTPESGCLASFVSVLDSANPLPNSFRFQSTSAGDPNRFRWRFSDGYVSEMPQVTHRFQGLGPHEACLRVEKEEHGMIVCADSVCQPVILPEYFNIGGHLFAGSYPINNPVPSGDTGIAYLFRKTGNSLHPVDTCRFTHLGYFTFPQHLSGTYIVRSELTSGSVHAAGFFPGYYTRSVYWTSADNLVLAGGHVYAADIRLEVACDTLQGPGSIRGKVAGSPALPGNPEWPGARVILLDGLMQPLLHAGTGEHGEFTFSGLPFGTYYARVEYPGLWSRLTLVWLDASAPVADSLLLELFDHDVTCAETGAVAGFRVGEPYPNPSSGVTMLTVDCPLACRLTAEIRSLAGTLLWTKTIACTAGMNRLTVPDFPCSQGICLLSMTTGGGTRLAVKKLVRLPGD